MRTKRPGQWLVFLVTALILSSLILLSCAQPATQTGAEFYKDKVVATDVFIPPGRDADLMSRLVAPSLKELLGAKQVLVVNRTGGGGIEAWNHTWNAQPDGLTFGIGEAADMALLNILEDPSAQFNTGEFIYLWGTPPRPILFNISAKQYNSFDELKAGKDLLFGAFTPGGNWAIMSVAVISIFDLDAKLVTGLKTDDRIRAIAQGDMDASLLTPIRTLQEVEGGLGLVKPVLIVGPERHKDFPDVPTLRELADMSDPDIADLVQICENVMIAGFTIFMAPGVPEDSTDFFAQAYDQAVMQNRAGVEEILRLDLTGRQSAEETQASVANILTPDKQRKFNALFTDLFDRYLVE